METEFRILGPVEAWAGDTRIVLFGPRQQRALAALLLDADRTVPIDRIVDAVWDKNPPPTAQRQVQDIVTRLRRALMVAGAPADIITTVNRGYTIRMAGHRLDAQDFQTLVTDAQQVADTDAATAVHTLRTALGLWRGPALAGLNTTSLRNAAATWNERRLSAWERCLRLELGLGHHREVISELIALADQQTFGEGPVGLLITALARSGRRADALQAYQQFRRRLVDELGVEPGSGLQTLHQAILLGEFDSAEPDPVRKPIPAPALTPAMLPLDISSFAGRRHEIQQLDQILAMAGDQPTAVVISAMSGTAGVGKTTLAVHWAQRVADRFPDGQLYLNLRGFDPGGSPTNPSTALAGFLNALAVRADGIPATLDEQVALYRSILAGRRVLVVLDNARDADQVRPLLPAAPGCVVLVTSRNQLTGLVSTEGAHPLTLDFLSTAEAREMLTRRLGRHRVTAEPDAVEEIIVASAGLPLALSVVAARAVIHAGLPLADLATDLKTSRGGLDAFDGGEATNNLRVVMSWSYRTLDEPTARLFRLLSIHPGQDFAIPAAASLAGIPVSQARHQLAELTRANLLTEHRLGRYTCHDLLRAYANELASTVDTEAERRAALCRLLDHYLHTAYAGEELLYPQRDRMPIGPPRPGVTQVHLSDREQAMTWFADEHPVLLSALRLAVDHELDGHTCHMAWAIAAYLSRRGYRQDWTMSLRAALTATIRLADRRAQAYAHGALGFAYIALNHHDDAQHHLEQSLDLYRALDDLPGQARAELNLGWICDKRNRPREALAHSQQALHLHHAAGHETGQAFALNAIGWSHAQLGEHEQAINSCEQALTLFTKTDNLLGQAVTWGSLGYIHLQRGQHHDAITYYNNAVVLRRDIGDRQLEADALGRLGDTHHAAGQIDPAADAYQQALTILEELQHPAADQIRAKLNHLATATFTADS